MKNLRYFLSLFIHPYRRLYLTPRGWIFCAITVGMGIVAINTGHNLFHLLFGFLLSAVLVSGILSETVLRGVAVQRHMPADVIARLPFPVLVELRNVYRRRTVYSIHASDSGDGFPVRSLGHVTALKPGETKNISYFLEVDKRGLYRLRCVRLSTRFPFGFFEKVRLIPLEDSFVAYPGQREIPDLRFLLSGNDQSGNRKQRAGEEVLSLRPAVPEDDHRLIHWRTSARVGQWMIKELAERLQHPLSFFFDNRGEEGERFEHAVESAANLLRWLAKNGRAVSFSTWEQHFESASSGRQMKAVMRHLALVAPAQGLSGRGYERWRAQARREHGGVFLRAGLPPPCPLPPCEIVSL